MKDANSDYLKSAESNSVIATLDSNVLRPAYNASIVQTWNAIANSVNVLGESSRIDRADNEFIPKLHFAETKPSELFSGTWFAQTISSGLAGVVPYVLAGGAAGKFIKAGFTILPAGGKTAAILNNDISAQVLGAAAFDFARDAHNGETRVGNMLGGATAFGVFGIGNRFSGGFGGVQKLGAQLAIGALGAEAQSLVSTGISQSRIITMEEAMSAAVSGATMNYMLPKAQALLGANMTKTANTSKGREIDAVRSQDGHNHFLDLKVAQFRKVFSEGEIADPELAGDLARHWSQFDQGQRESILRHTKPELILAVLDGKESAITNANLVGHNVLQTIGSTSSMINPVLDRPLMDFANPKQIKNAFQALAEAYKKSPDNVEFRQSVFNVAERIGSRAKESYDKNFANTIKQSIEVGSDSVDRVAQARELFLIQAGSPLQIPIEFKVVTKRSSAEHHGAIREQAEQMLLGTDHGLGGAPQALVEQLGGRVLADKADHLKAIREHPEFAAINKSQQLDLLWSALLSRSNETAAATRGMSSGSAEPGSPRSFAWQNSLRAWQILESLNYPPERIQRVAALLARHGELSYDGTGPRPSIRIAQDPAFRDDIATFYRNPVAAVQLKILNETNAGVSGVGNMHAVRTEQTAMATLLSQRSRELNAGIVPVLTTELPRQFGIYSAGNDFALMTHGTNLRSLIKGLGVIESPMVSLSTSLVTPGNTHLANMQPIVVALLKAPAENISGAANHDLGSGLKSGWIDHVTQTVNAPYSVPLANFQRRVRQQLEGAGQRDGDLWNITSAYADASEAIRAGGAAEAVIRGINHSMDPDGKVPHSISSWNEVKINNPIFSGFGIFRRGAVLDFGKGSIPQNQFDQKLNPNWLAKDGKERSLYIDPELVAFAKYRHKPFIVFD